MLYISTLDARQLEVGGYVPEILGFDYYSNKIEMTKFGKNKVVLVKFWSYRCNKCRETMPLAYKRQKKYESKGFIVFVISVGYRTEDYNYLRDNDLDFSYAASYKELAGVNSISFSHTPYQILVGRDFKIVALGENISDEDIEKALAKK